MQNFLEAVEAGYSKYNNPYHNLVHATDVLQTTYNILNSTGLMSWLSNLEIFAIFISAIIHDFEHTGTTNSFHMQTQSDIAITYNDRAVLENYHVSATFRLIKQDSYNICAELTREEFKEFRQLVIDMVLATDMSCHFTQLKSVKNMISLNEPIDKPKALSLLLHCADISHPSKEWGLHEKWTNLLVSEFFAQGDKEKELGLPFSPLCDRNNTPIAQSQIGFINFIVEPSLMVMGDMIDKVFEQIMAEDQASSARTSKSNCDIDNATTGGNTPSSSQANLSVAGSTSAEKKPIERPWAVNLANNKLKWQALVDKEKAEKEQKQKDDDDNNNSNNSSNNKNESSTSPVPVPEKQTANEESMPKNENVKETETEDKSKGGDVKSGDDDDKKENS